MNNVLQLKGKKFIQENKNVKGGGPSINGKETVTNNKINRLTEKLKQIKQFWMQETRPFSGVLISVHYNKIAAKSNRIGGLFKGNKSNNAIVGAKFNTSRTKHIITYFISMQELVKSIELLSDTNEVLQILFNGSMNQDVFEDKEKKYMETFKQCEKFAVKKSVFKQIIADVSYIDDFEIDTAEKQTQQSIVTLYNTDIETKDLLKKLGIDILSSRILDNQTVFLDTNQLDVLYEKAPYLVSMATVDMSELSPSNFIQEHQHQTMDIPYPSLEPTIGVIDTLFDERVYFSPWVEYHEMIDNNIPKTQNDYKHGTAVSSIIVDGHVLNPWLDDGCGRFKVRHFGVATGAQFSSFTITKQIKEIIANNRDIKVWNISLGSNQEVNHNFISAEAAILDQIQHENDIIFVVAGTNKPNENIERIGSPADSINSMVVNAVTKNGLSTKYARKGIALSFFAKPDVSYYGGSNEEYIKVCEPLGEAKVAGTSFAAPWIARKLSYLIDILGLNREIAKALIIDAARDWNENPTPSQIALYGHGVVPIKIENIISTKEDEIKFLITDVSEKWNTFNYSFPVPIHENKYPYVAKATMCYFPMCNRVQGVDYTNTELNVKFGRIQNNGKIKDIKGDKQNLEDDLGTERYYLSEEEARMNFRKWDNVKYVVEIPTSRKKPKITYDYKNWGMEIKTNNRLNPQDGVGVRFGVVVTLKEINGVNRIEEFIHNCHLNGWLVNELDVKLRVDVHKKVNESIEWE
ncbi:S8 family peptidase [Listeria booriae]|uniref:S8 family peptidase n=2 Tax=Listeria booriae TaxID=1552123 RepID=A0A7X0Y0D6_9LIST|nr:S8 family peptidase [Listeria booriae]MBC1795063.1 S8 family peptidase [Listeria booriae]MBC1800440.1 S8 family peptidase [Listeria booriae]MBC1802997.1 S8 family peptidase [Listeria booriae]MBC1813009.1 S8 family peptidase [Listeria booriae]